MTSRFQGELAACRGRVAGSHHGVRGYVAGQSGLRHHAACQRGAVFTGIDAVMGTRSGREQGPTLASSVVAEEVAGRGEVWF